MIYIYKNAFTTLPVYFIQYFDFHRKLFWNYSTSLIMIEVLGHWFLDDTPYRATYERRLSNELIRLEKLHWTMMIYLLKQMDLEIPKCDLDLKICFVFPYSAYAFCPFTKGTMNPKTQNWYIKVTSGYLVLTYRMWNSLLHIEIYTYSTYYILKMSP